MCDSLAQVIVLNIVKNVRIVYLSISVKSFLDGEVVVKACWVAESGWEEVLTDSSSDESIMNLRLANLDLVLDDIEYQLIALKLYN